MAENRDVQNIKETIKRLLREKGKTQSDLADHLDLSLPSIKKLLNQSDIGLDRLVQTAEFLNLTVYELLEISKRSSVVSKDLTEKQEKVLISPLHFKVFKSLTSGLELSEIKKFYRLDEKKLQKVLLALERADLLYLIEGKVRLRVAWPWNPIPGGEMEKKLTKKWTQKTVEAVLSRAGYVTKTDQPANFFRRAEFLLTKKTASELRQDLEELAEEYMEKAKLDRNTHPRKNLNHHAFFTGVGYFSGWDLIEDEIS